MQEILPGKCENVQREDSNNKKTNIYLIYDLYYLYVLCFNVILRFKLCTNICSPAL